MKNGAYQLIGLLLCIGILLGVACQKQDIHVRPAFYHWQTRLSLSEPERQYLEDLKVEKLYVKFFDVDREGEGQEAVALAQLQVEGKLPQAVEIIPTIFITNRTMRGISEKTLDSLSQRIYRKVGQLWQQFSEHELREVQLDCDWSGQTREAYFRLLELLRSKWRIAGVDLSVTIRLHQLKFPEQTGVPPADRGMLMFYNMGQLDNPATNNSILDIDIANTYLNGAPDYPLDLDIALPVFAWGVLYRDGRMIKLINNLRADALTTDQRFDKTSENTFQANKSTYLEGHYLYEQDMIRCEEIAIEQLQESAMLLKSIVRHSPLTITFYHLDTATIKHYPYARLEALCQQFEN